MQILVHFLFARILILSSSYSNILHFFSSRAQAGELWVKSEKVTCGYISEDTRVRVQQTGGKQFFPFFACKVFCNSILPADLYGSLELAVF